MDPIASYVERFALDKILSEDLLDSLCALRYAPGEHIFRKAEPLRRLLFFVEGRAKVYNQMENGSSLLVRFYSPFDILGDVELFAFDHYLLDVVAMAETVCLGLDAKTVKQAVDRNSRLLAYLCGRLGVKLAGFNSLTAVNLRYPVENRLASYLLTVANEDGAALDTENLGELADILGTSYRQLSRVVRRFRNDGMLETGRGRIRILSRDKLAPLARDL